MTHPHYIKPQWPTPPHIKAFTTTRQLKETSSSPYAEFNLGNHSGDEPERIAQNRAKLRLDLALPSDPTWLKQVHGTEIVELTQTPLKNITADAAYTKEPNVICAILTADCLPVLFWDPKSNQVAAVHAGWRGLAAGIIPKTATTLTKTPKTLFTWLGPAIGPQHFEVGKDVYEAFIQQNTNYQTAFIPKEEKWRMNIYQIARQQLEQCGIEHIFSDHFCTYQQADLFYSYRRDGQASGRMATIIYSVPEKQFS